MAFFNIKRFINLQDGKYHKGSQECSLQQIRLERQRGGGQHVTGHAEGSHGENVTVAVEKQ
jgi:hypothetical protein